MPVFGRRSRSVSVSRPTPPLASSSAQLAASQAFMAARGSQSNLSASAAATALRTMSPTPTPIDQIQTKRMVERQSSVDPAQTASRGRSRGGVQRRSSSSSMTERTFRSPSPGRPVAGDSSRAPVAAPPVPRLPDTYTDIPPIPKKSQRRSMSIDDMQFRNNQRAPDPRSYGDLGSIPQGRSAPAAQQPAPVSPAAAAAKRVTSLQKPPGLERSNSNNSINFSYPRGTRPNSPPPRPANSSPQAASATVDAQNTAERRVKPITAAETEQVQHNVIQAAQQPVKKKKKRIDRQAAEGTHLNSGTMAARPVVTPLEHDPQPQASPPDETQTATSRTTSGKLTGQATHFPPSPNSPTDSSGGSDADVVAERAKDRRAQRASGVLTKQPSVVREDWEGEQEEEPVSSMQRQQAARMSSPTPAGTSKRASAPANSSRKIEEPPQISRPEKQPPPAVYDNRNLAAPDMSSAVRGPSLSPSRSTRFSNRLSSDIMEGRKHDPPPRSVSPGKPALKHHSPSPQPLPEDINRRRDPSLSPSEGTDASVEGVPKRKKNAHVSFNSEPSVVGIAAQPDSSDSPVVSSPQYRETSKKWFGLKSRNAPLHSPVSEEDEEEAMKPRPQLPTFGSVRKGRNETSPTSTPAGVASLPQTFASPISSSSSASSRTDPPTLDTSISSDHAIGVLLSHEALQKPARDPLLPLAPDVTSVEGTGMVSDTESHYSGDEEEAPNKADTVRSQPPPLISSSTTVVPPAIQVQPSTPGHDEEDKPTDQWLVEVPGGFPGQEAQIGTTDAVTKSVPVPEAPSNAPSDQHVTASPPKQSYEQEGPYDDHNEEAATDNDSIYSDAAEDLSDLEGDGFGSINAIVHSPVPPSPTFPLSSPPESPLMAKSERSYRPSEAQGQEAWDDTQTRWSNLAQQAKQASLEPALPIVDTSAKPVGEKKKKKPKKISQVSETAVLDSPPRVPNQGSAYPNVNKTQPSSTGQTQFRRSMRENQDTISSGTLRTSMRSGTESTEQKQPRDSVRNASAVSAAAASARPQPAQTERVQPKGTLQKKSLRAAPQQRQALPPVNNDSDSESSFKRRRRNRQTQTGVYSMRKSMRGAAPEDEYQAPSPDPRRGVRSLSPTARRPFSAGGGQATLRTSMRAPMEETPPPSKRSSSLFNRSRKTKSPVRPVSMMGTSSKAQSRLNDSDDEAVPIPTSFRSRYEDSSDDEGDLNLRPVRGIPRKQDAGDSTDLEDSSEDDANKQMPKVLKIQPPAAGSVPNEPGSPSSPTTKKKRGLFSRFRKEKEEPASPNAANTIGARADLEMQKKETPPKKSKATALGFSSKAEQEAMIEATRQKLEATQERPQSPTPGKLQRRATPQRIMSDSWPLPPKLDHVAEDRPYTADGINGDASARPGLGERQSTPVTIDTTSPSSVIGRSGKKKRFPMLRKAFGLKD